MSSKVRISLFILALAYALVSIFLGGYPFRHFLPAFVFNGKLALGVLAVCVAASRGFFTRVNRDNLLEALGLLGILLVAALLRFHDIAKSAAWGPTIDEPILVVPVLGMLRTGNLDTGTYEYGGVWFYILLAVFMVVALRMVSTFAYKDSTAIPEQAYYLAARYAAALFSLLTVAAVYMTARRFFGRIAAMAAGLILTLSWLSFATAHQNRLDLALALFVLLAHYFFLRILEEPVALHYLLAGMFCGLSLGTKYTVVSIFVPLLLAHGFALDWKRILNWNLLLALASAAAVFLLFNYYSIAHINLFLQRLSIAVYHNLTPEHWSVSQNRPLENFGLVMTQGVGVVALIPALMTLWQAISQRDNKLLVLWCFPLFLLALLGSYPSGFPRYLMPALPILAVLAGAGTQSLVDRLSARVAPRGRPILAAAAILAMTAIPAWKAVEYWVESGKVLKPEVVVDWIRQNVPRGAVIIIDPTGPLLPSDEYKLVSLDYTEFRPRNLRDAQYICVTEDLFKKIPESFRILKDFPARTKSLDRSIRVYGSESPDPGAIP